MRYRVITGTLEARTAVHVGSGEGNELADSLLRRDTDGNVLIPGTAIAGALRSMLTRLAPRLGHAPCVALLSPEKRDARKQKGCDCAVCRLFGDVEPSDEGVGEEVKSTSAASHLLVFNAYRSGENEAQTFVRDGVGIDRASGTSARATGAKFALEMLPARALFELRMELREPESASDAEIKADQQLLAIALAEWKERRAHLGGDVARGLGAFELKELHYKECDFDDPDWLMAFLRESRPWEEAQEKQGWLQNQLNGVTQDGIVAWEDLPAHAATLPVTRGWVEWSFTLRANGPFLTHDTIASGTSGFDHAPLLEMLSNWNKPVLPGSSLRGVLRSHAERIARTLTTHHALEQDDAQVYFLSRCPACDPLRVGKADTALESCDSLLRHKAKVSENKEIVPAQLCLACRLFGSTRLGSRLIVEDAPYANADGEKPTYKMLDFLAIDRFTGGDAEGFKFDALALWRPTFQVRLFLDNPEEWEMGWLTLVLRDLAEGWLRVGFGAAKGFGHVTIDEGMLRRATLDPERANSGQPSLFVVDEQPLLEWSRASEWVKAFNKKVQGFQREANLDLPADSYFGVVDHIYGGEAR